MADEKRTLLCNTLKNKFCNLIVDSGTYGGKTRFLVKVGRPMERLKSFAVNSNSSKSYPNINNIQMLKSNSKLTGIDITYLPKEVDWASSCVQYLTSVGKNNLKLLSETHAYTIINNLPQKDNTDFFDVKNNSPFLLRSYGDIKTSSDYIKAIVNAVKIVHYFKGKVGSITGDQLLCSI